MTQGVLRGLNGVEFLRIRLPKLIVCEEIGMGSRRCVV